MRSGAPPHPRGKGSASRAGGCAARITPAHAGKSISAVVEVNYAEDHPRPCGEKICFRKQRCYNTGSPPPMRGKVNKRRILQCNLRITPAHAGKSRRLCVYHRTVQDHPRPCGEKKELGMTIDELVGSPPPMRGKDYQILGGHGLKRITPAHAGKRPRRRRGLSTIRGSPPPMRGKASILPPPVAANGITPAHAGKSCRAWLPIFCIRDHPRPCGEKPRRRRGLSTIRGSPPPMRGKGPWP